MKLKQLEFLHSKREQKEKSENRGKTCYLFSNESKGFNKEKRSNGNKLFSKSVCKEK